MKIRLPWRKADWDHYEFRRPFWPEGIMSWTYKRSVNPWIWAIFGNDRDGCTPWMGGKVWGWFEWWIRNSKSNYANCISGLALYRPDPDAWLGDDAWPDSPTMERKFWIGSYDIMQNQEHKFVLSWCRDSAQGKNWWRPYIRIPLPFSLAFWWGWKPTNGHGTCSIKRVD